MCSHVQGHVLLCRFSIKEVHVCEQLNLQTVAARFPATPEVIHSCIDVQRVALREEQVMRTQIQMRSCMPSRQVYLALFQHQSSAHFHQHCSSFLSSQVSRHANYTRLFSLCTHSWHCDAILPQLELLQPEDIEPFVASILTSCHVEALLHGNMTADEGLTLAKQVGADLGHL